MTRFSLVGSFSCGLALVVGCAPAASSYVPGQTVVCESQLRTVVDCGTYATLKHEIVEANAGLKDLGFGLGGRYETAALGQVRESTEQLALTLESTCRDYNACVTDAAGYLSFKGQALARLSKHLSLVTEQRSGPTAAVGDAIWSNAEPDAAAQRLVLRYAVSARQGARFVTHRSGDSLTSGTELRIELETNRTAYVYLVLVTPNEAPLALLPNPNFGAANPVPANSRISLPPPDVTLLLDRHPGTEHLEFIASLTPIAGLEPSLAALSVSKPSAPASKVTASSRVRTDLLTDIGKLICAPRLTDALRIAGTRAECGDVPNRGLLLVKRDPSALEGQIAATPNDDVVVYQHEILHR